MKTSRRQLCRQSLRALCGVFLATRLSRARAHVLAQLDVRDFGATGDGHALDTRAFQRAIDACSHSGGGIVEVPPRTYVIGTVYLKSGVTLHLAEGAVLLGSTNPKDYGLVDSFKDAVNRVRGFTLIGAIDAQDVRITGKGTVDGRGIELQKNGNGPDARPFLVRWVRCRGVEISDVELKNSAAWTMHFFQCQDANVSGVRIDSFGVDNNDGIDIDSSQRITVEDCTIFSEDDSICIKTTSVVPSMQIRVRNCTLRTHHGAMKIGTESMGDIEDVVFSQCRVIDAREGAIKFCSEDGANIRNVRVEDIQIDSADTPVFLRLGTRMRTYRNGDPKLSPGSLDGITLRRITVRDATRIGILVSGVPGHLIKNIWMEDISIHMKGEIRDAKAQLPDLPEKEVQYPEVWMFGPDMPAYATYLRHVEAAKFVRIAIEVELPDVRPALFLQDAHDASWDALRITGNPLSSCVAVAENSSGVHFDQPEYAFPAESFLKLVNGVGRDTSAVSDGSLPHVDRRISVTS